MDYSVLDEQYDAMVRLAESHEAELAGLTQAVFHHGVTIDDVVEQGLSPLRAETTYWLDEGGEDPDIQAATVYHCQNVPGGTNVPPGGTHVECTATPLPEFDCASIGYPGNTTYPNDEGNGVWFCVDDMGA
jgi:hypothetical protein